MQTIDLLILQRPGIPERDPGLQFLCLAFRFISFFPFNRNQFYQQDTSMTKDTEEENIEYRMQIIVKSNFIKYLVYTVIFLAQVQIFFSVTLKSHKNLCAFSSSLMIPGASIYIKQQIFMKIQQMPILTCARNISNTVIQKPYVEMFSSKRNVSTNTFTHIYFVGDYVTYIQPFQYETKSKFQRISKND